MQTNRELVEQTITQDLFGPAGLTEAAEVEVPDKYEVLSCLGRGGFGAVYKARDKSLDRFVAIKVLTEARPTDLERFRREARFAARLNDPAIVQVFEFAEHAGTPYIAMQFIDGVSLAEKSLSLPESVAAVTTTAKALQRAHAEGIVHRDVKPGNLLIDKTGRTYLTDFGIARDIQGIHGFTLSQEGMIMGTPALMSPEQARGDLQAIDARADVYGLGSTLYFLLCNRYPLERTNLVDLLHAVLHVEPPLPRSINPSIPRAVEAIIVRCMQKERSRRYQSMGDVIADLEAYAAGKSLEGESEAWFRRLVGAQAPKPPSDPDLFQTIGFEIVRQIAAWDANLYRVSKNVNRLDAQLESIVRRLDSIIDDHPDVAWPRFYRGVALARLGRLQDALDEMERSIDRLANHADAQFEMGRLYLALFLREQREAHKHFSKTGTQYHLSDHRGRLQQAVVCFNESRRLRQDLPHWQIEFAEAVTRLADEDVVGCLTVCDRILARDTDIDDVWKLRGDAQRISGGDPIADYDEAIRIRRSFFEAYLAKAEVYNDRGVANDARDCLKQALEVRPDAVDVLVQMARSYLVEARTIGARMPEARSELTDADLRQKRVLLDEALAHADRAIAVSPNNYDIVVTRVEILLEMSRLSNDPASLSSPLAALQSAEKLPGCQNRVNYLIACAMLERARLNRAAGLSAVEDLKRVLDSACGEAAHVPDNDPWLRLRAAAEAEMNDEGAPASRYPT